MPVPRIYCGAPISDGQEIFLDGQAASHILKVLRLKVNDTVELFDGKNRQYTAHITQVGKKQVELSIDHHELISREPPLSITLIQGIARGERMDWMLQKATELGVHRIIPTFMTRSVVKLDNKRIESRLKHWHGIITHACEQCGRNQLPLLDQPADDLTLALNADQSDLRYYLDPDGTLKLRDIKLTPTHISLVVGPEGGFDGSEKTLMDQLEIQSLALGPRVLRTETAGIVALSAIGAIWGDL